MNFTFSKDIYSDSQVLKSNHWVYDSMYRLSMESKNAFSLNTTPLSVAELKFYLSEVDSSTLSEYGKELYNKVSDYLNSAPHNNDVNSYANIILAPEYYIRSNDQIETDNHYYYKDNFLSIPLGVGFGENFAFQATPTIGTSFYTQKRAEVFTNLPPNVSDAEWEIPRFVYGNFSKDFGKIGFNFQIAKQGLAIGKTEMGSIIYNDTFETDLYTQTSLYSKRFKFTLGFMQVDFDNFIYLHQYYFRPFDNLNITIIEGGLNHGNVDFKNLNPFILMHNLFSSDIYAKVDPTKYDLNRHYCAYLGLNVEYFPIKNLRLYGLFALSELQLPNELGDGTTKYAYANTLPDGYALQGGFDFNISTKNKNLVTTNFEALYILPFMYMRQSVDWSLVRVRHDKNHNKDIYSWLGSPYGPDTMAINFKVGYEYQDRLKLNLGYRLVMNGEMNYKVFDKDHKKDGVNYPAYYPSVLHQLGVLPFEEAKKIARNTNLSGVVESKHQITLECSYEFNEKLSVNGKVQENIVYNCQNQLHNFQSGLDCSFAVKYCIF